MRTLPLAAIFAASVIELLSRPAAAHGPANVPAVPAGPDTAGEPVQGNAPPSGDDDTRVRDLQERLFANEALSLSGRRPMRGDVPLQAAAFYTLVGRPDLVERMQERRRAKGIAIGVGAAAVTLGIVVGIVDSAATTVDNTTTGACLGNPSSCRQSSAVPWIVAAGGGIALIAGLAVPTDPLSPDEKSALIDGHNRQLRAHMGLSSALEAAKRTASVRAAVRPDDQSGMLLAGCSF